jgi:hypothetical protein
MSTSLSERTERSGMRVREVATRHLAAVIACAVAVACGTDGLAPATPAPSIGGTPSFQYAWAPNTPNCGESIDFEVALMPGILEVGQQGEAAFNPGNQTGGVTWTSSDTAVVKVAMMTPDDQNYRAYTNAVGAGYSCIKAVVMSGAPSIKTGVSRIAVPGVRVVPASIGGAASTTQGLTVAAAVAADGSPIPGGTITWTSDAPAIASVDLEGGVRLNAAGNTNVHAQLLGGSATVPVSVRPETSISGPTTAQVEGQTATFLASTVGCNTVCTYQWSMSWIDRPSGIFYERTLGTAATQSVRAPFDTYQYELDVVTTSNGVSDSDVRLMRVVSASGCTSRTGC